MKNFVLYAIYILLGLMIAACSSTQETTTSPQQTITSAQMAQWEEQQRINEGAQRMGLDQEETRMLKEYAEKKARLECRLKKLDESAAQAFSEVDQSDIKQQIITLDQELNALAREIDEYCKDDPERSRFFFQVHKQYAADCD